MASDIDFDELDKAVNSLMGGVKEPEDDMPKAKTFEVKDTLKPGEDPMYDKLGEVARGIGSETLEGEREKTVVEDFSPDAETDRPAPKLPVEESDDEQKNEQPSEQKSETESESEQEPKLEQTADVRPPAARRPTTGSRFMDVVHPALDMKSTTASTMPVPSRPIMTVSRVEELPTDKDHETTKQQDELLVTPFLPDANAKVEKRPLGGADLEPQSEEPEEQGVEVFGDGNDRQDDAQKLAEPSDITPELSEEERALQSIETEPVDESLLDEDAMRHAESGDTGGIHNDEQREGHKKDHHDKKATTPAIYDIENYHQPLKAASKKKMGALKITGIVLLVIVLSAAVGAGAVYILFSMGL